MPLSSGKRHTLKNLYNHFGLVTHSMNDLAINVCLDITPLIAELNRDAYPEFFYVVVVVIILDLTETSFNSIINCSMSRCARCAGLRCRGICACSLQGRRRFSMRNGPLWLELVRRVLHGLTESLQTECNVTCWLRFGKVIPLTRAYAQVFGLFDNRRPPHVAPSARRLSRIIPRRVT